MKTHWFGKCPKSIQSDSANLMSYPYPFSYQNSPQRGPNQIFVPFPNPFNNIGKGEGQFFRKNNSDISLKIFVKINEKPKP